MLPVWERSCPRVGPRRRSGGSGPVGRGLVVVAWRWLSRASPCSAGQYTDSPSPPLSPGPTPDCAHHKQTPFVRSSATRTFGSPCFIAIGVLVNPCSHRRYGAGLSGPFAGIPVAKRPAPALSGNLVVIGLASHLTFVYARTGDLAGLSPGF